MNMTPAQQALANVLTLLPRIPLTELEAVGLNESLKVIRGALKEHADFKNPPKPEQ